jgi:hypothetical protein
MFIDLVKARKAAPSKKKDTSDEISDARLDEIMSELFGDDDEDEPQPQPRKVKKGARYDLEKAIEDEDEDDLEDDEDEMEKGMSRREMMNQVYSMVDDLSDDELDKFLSDRQIKKAQVMAVFEQMPTSDLKELVSARDANGAAPMSPIAMKGAGYGYNDMDMTKGEDEDDLDLEDDLD